MEFHNPTEIQRDIRSLDNSPFPTWLTSNRISAVSEVEESPFSQQEYENRLATVRARMADSRLDGILVFRPSSVDYLCGYHSAETVPQPLLVTPSETRLYVPDLEVGRALASSRADRILFSSYATARDALALIARNSAEGTGRGACIAIELGHTSTPPQMAELLTDSGLAAVPANCVVERVQLTLSTAEIRCVEEAARATDRGVQAAIKAALEPNATDSSMAAAIAAALFREATSPSAWGPVVATGRRGGIPHSSWHRGALSESVTFVEFAGAHQRYHAPIMRTLCHGPASSDATRLASHAKDVLSAVLENAKPGVACAEVARVARDAVGPLGNDVVFHNLFGYPVGLAHPPHWMDGAAFYITVDNPEPIQEGMVFHIPGSFRSFGELGVGLSHTFVVEAQGARVLTHGDAELIEL